jgi:predicted MFS family arabinose efflux permease
MKVLISRTFHVAQGTAMGLTFIGASGGAVLVPVIVATLIEAYGWRDAFAYLSTGIWLVALPLMVFGLREKHLDRRRAKSSTAESSRNPGGMTLQAMLRERRFWLILFVLSTVGLVDQAMIQHTNLYLELDVGFEPATVAWAISIFGLAGVAGRFFLGVTFDRFSVRGVALGYLILSASFLLALPVAGMAMLLLFVTCRGVGHAAVLMDSPIFAKHCYGRQHLGLLIGIFTAVINLGFALGPWIMARMFRTYGSYAPSFWLFAGLALLCALVSLTIEPTRWLDYRARRGEQP